MGGVDMPGKAGAVKLGLIGKGIGRTQSNTLHQVCGALCGLNVTYDLFDVADGGPDFDLAARLGDCAGQGFAGVNVTHPFKQQAHDLTTPSAEVPAGLTSVNTVVFRGGEMISFNTDYSGCVRVLGRTVAPAGRVLLMGAGGVGIAIAHAVARCGADEIAIADTDGDRAAALAKAVMTAAPGMTARVAMDDLIGEARRADGLINATPLGMHQYPGCVLADGAFGGQRWAFDAVYTPVETTFSGLARAAGLEVVSGFDLFVCQALDGFEKFTGIRVAEDRARRAFGARSAG